MEGTRACHEAPHERRSGTRGEALWTHLDNPKTDRDVKRAFRTHLAISASAVAMRTSASTCIRSKAFAFAPQSLFT
jgi:hypothetical protein